MSHQQESENHPIILVCFLVPIYFKLFLVKTAILLERCQHSKKFLLLTQFPNTDLDVTQVFHLNYCSTHAKKGNDGSDDTAALFNTFCSVNKVCLKLQSSSQFNVFYICSM